MNPETIFDFPLSVWIHAIINLGCVIFAFWFFRRKRFQFLSYGFVSEWAFQAFTMFVLFLMFNVFFGVRVEILRFYPDDSLSFQSWDIFLSAVFALIVFTVAWCIERMTYSKRKQ